MNRRTKTHSTPVLAAVILAVLIVSIPPVVSGQNLSGSDIQSQTRNQTTTSSQTQIKYGGYLAFDFAKSQEEGTLPNWAFDQAWGGFYVAGMLSGKYGFTAELTYTKDAEFMVKQAWAGFIPSQKFSVKVGMYLVPFGNWNQADRPYEQALTETPLNLQYLYPASWRDIGVLVEGKMSMVSYSFYLGNGLKEADYLSEGQQLQDNNHDFAKGGRLALALSEYISLGASYYEGAYDDAGERKLKLRGLDMSFITSQWEIHGEYAKGSIGNPEGYDDGKSEGFSIWGIMSFHNFQPVASYQKMKYNDAYHGDGIARNESRWTVGLRCTLGNSFYVKGEYAWNKETPVLKNNVLRFQAVIAF